MSTFTRSIFPWVELIKKVYIEVIFWGTQFTKYPIHLLMQRQYFSSVSSTLSYTQKVRNMWMTHSTHKTSRCSFYIYATKSRVHHIHFKTCFHFDSTKYETVTCQRSIWLYLSSTYTFSSAQWNIITNKYLQGVFFVGSILSATKQNGVLRCSVGVVLRQNRCKTCYVHSKQREILTAVNTERDTQIISHATRKDGTSTFWSKTMHPSPVHGCFLHHYIN